MKKFNWTNIRLIVIFGVAIFLFSFSGKRNDNRKILKTKVEFVSENNPFLTKESVNKLLIEKNQGRLGFKKVELDLSNLEKKLNSHNMIKNTEVYVSVDGVLKTVVEQKTPVARVFNENSSFYIDYQGGRMPVSDNFSARVPLVDGSLSELKNEKITQVLQTIHDDEFLQKNIIGVNISPSGNLQMSSRNFNYVIDFGKPINIEKKFKNYKAFFQRAVHDTLIKNYKTVNLKFTQQVVCTKN